MAEVTNELMYDVLKQLQADMSSLKLGQAEQGAEMQAFRGHLYFRPTGHPQYLRNPCAI